jgi:hypothetical protein
MPIRVDHQRITQTFASPAIYFDHWAIRSFTDDTSLQDRLVKLVHNKAATFLLSGWNIAEFAKVADPRHAHESEDFLERLMPNVYVTDFDVGLAVRHVGEAQSMGLHAFPSPFREVMNLLWLLSLEGEAPLTIRGILTRVIKDRDEIAERLHTVSQAMADTLNAQKRDPDFVRKIRAMSPQSQPSRVHLMYGELMRDLVLDAEAPITANDAADWQHAALPALYCDFLLLDSAWVARVNRVGERARGVGIEFALPQCFSKRDDGLRRFLDAFGEFTAA